MERGRGRRPWRGEVEWKGEGTRETALAAQWEDYPMPGLVAAAAAAWTGGSVLGGGTERRQQAADAAEAAAVQEPSKDFHFYHPQPQERPRRAPPGPAGTKWST